MAIAIVVGVILVSICLMILVFVIYKHYQRKKKLKVRHDKSEINIEESNLEEVTLKALEKPKESQGKLVYSLSYDAENQMLKIFIKSCHDLLAMDPGGTSDPYVRLCLKDSPKKKKDTKIKKRTLNPVYNEEICLEIPDGDPSAHTLVMAVYDFDRFSKHDIIGTLVLHLDKLDLSKTIDDWGELEQNSSDKEDLLGDLCISMKYMPAEGKLLVVIIEGKDLKKHLEEDYHDPFVKVALLVGDKKIKKKKTSIKKTTPHPYFNEEFSFSLTSEMIPKVELRLTVYNSRGGSMKNRMAVGNVILGPLTKGAGLKHWKEITSNPNRPIAHWHSLVEVLNQ